MRRSRGLGDVYKRQVLLPALPSILIIRDQHEAIDYLIIYIKKPENWR
jgi:hypothetical protein